MKHRPLRKYLITNDFDIYIDKRLNIQQGMNRDQIKSDNVF